MTSHFNGISSYPKFKGGAEANNNSTCTIVLIVVVIVLIVVVLGCLLYNMSYSSSPAGGAIATAAARMNKNKSVGTLTKNPTNPHKRHVRLGQGVMSDPMPGSQLMSGLDMSNPQDAMFIPSSSGQIGDAEASYPSSDFGGTSANAFTDSYYMMDQGIMTPPANSDIQSLQTFLPNMSDGLNTSNGPVDPATGLPLFTAGKLIRSQLLGGYGPGNFLRQQQDPMSGYKRLGKNICGVQTARRDINVRRNQFNQARLADATGDPVLFSNSEFAYY